MSFGTGLFGAGTFAGDITAAVDLTGTGSLTADWAASVYLTGTGSLSVAGVHTGVGTVTMSGTGQLFTSPVTDANLSGTGALSASGIHADAVDLVTALIGSIDFPDRGRISTSTVGHLAHTRRG